MNHINEFIQTFKPLLTTDVYKVNQYSRYSSFEFLVKELLSKNRPVHIIETGTLNSDNDWLGYGQSTLIWDWLINITKGSVHSVDIDIEKIRFGRARCHHINFVHCDSIGYLRGIDASELDLLYLDSMNYTSENNIQTSLHHMGELAAIYDRLPSGCLVAVDDRHTKEKGKHVLVELFFEKIVKIDPIVICHTIVWKKP